MLVINHAQGRYAGRDGVGAYAIPLAFVAKLGVYNAGRQKRLRRVPRWKRQVIGTIGPGFFANILYRKCGGQHNGFAFRNDEERIDAVVARFNARNRDGCQLEIRRDNQGIVESRANRPELLSHKLPFTVIDARIALRSNSAIGNQHGRNGHGFH